MAMQHYDGPLGTFDYDDTQFELQDTDRDVSDGCMSLFNDYEGGNCVYCIDDLAEDLLDASKQYLRYVGSETDGSKIHIPDGIKSCMGMFARTDIESVPSIPDSALFIDGMCLCCRNLEVASALPARLKNMGYCWFNTYAGCYNIDSIAVPGDDDSYFIPRVDDACGEVQIYHCPDINSKNMKLHMSELGRFAYDPDEFIPLSDGVRYIGDETDGSKIKIPDGIENAHHMFSGCELNGCPTIPESIAEECKNDMFEGTNVSEKTINWAFANRGFTASSSHENVSYNGKFGSFSYNPDEFEILSDYVRYIGTETDGSKIKIPDGITKTDYMFANNQSLVTPPVIPESVKTCQCMFVGCSSLKQPPVIPDTISWGVSDMFAGCSRSVKLKGQWNAENRGQQYDEQKSMSSKQRESTGFDFE